MAAVTLKSVVLGEGRTKVIVPVTGRDAAELVAQVEALAAHEFDIIEWRADFLDAVTDPDAVVAVGRDVVRAAGGRPILFTIRTSGEGGEQEVRAEQYVATTTAVIEAGLADAVDVELRYGREAGDAVQEAARAAGVPVVGSWHDFHSTPPVEQIVATLTEMRERGFDVAKVAVMPTDVGDVLALLQATWEMGRAHPETPLLTMSMGGRGALSRMAAPVVGSCATFAMVGRPSAPGQVPVEELRPILNLLESGL
ncbi:MAG: type I 3-dehydroquinate dehydratase [bacterium]|nr:type I 3-dehydroquinate dehydratase [bacterium]